MQLAHDIDGPLLYAAGEPTPDEKMLSQADLAATIEAIKEALGGWEEQQNRPDAPSS
jgi:hypothetical protein